MAQIIPPITSLPVDSTSAPSVEDIQDRLPSICVDYLSHNWTEEDVWASWRNMTRHKHEIANGVRLENASWRTWNKQRNKLRTISPETLNWLKDSDVTWLYGPLHTANVEPVRPMKVSSTDDRLGIDRGTHKPGILKHRTLTELLSIPPNASSLLEDGVEEEVMESLASPFPDRPIIPHAKSDSHLARSKTLPARRSGRSPSVTKKPALRSKETSPDNQPPSNKRHISFNTFVEQVIALDEPVVRRSSNDSDSDDVLEIRRLSRFQRSNSNHSNHSATSSSTTDNNSSIIAKIPPGVLKTSGSYMNNPALPKLVYMPPVEYRSPQAEQPPAVVSPLQQVPPQQKGWSIDESERYGNHVGGDYFGGPDLTSGSPSNYNPGAYFGGAPAVQAPPTQPKWRQQSVDSASSSSSSSSLNGMVGQQPQRSILKVRPVNPNPSTPEPVSPPVLFNYNPSVATGIGGMFGGYEGAAQAGINVGSPPNEREERGRSTMRGNGSSQYDRSASRTASVSSSTSSHSSVCRSPAEATPIKTATRPASDKAATDAMDVDQSPDRSLTPTPHSSPQIVLRPLKNTSPSSLPHASVRSPPAAHSELARDLPHASVPLPNLDGTASPTLSSQPDDDDGSTLIGRATNIANTAKDLLGALWYGAQDDATRPRSQPLRR